MNHNEQQLLNATYTATRELRAEIDALKARVTALDGGAALPPDQSVAQPQPQPTESCEAYMMRHAPEEVKAAQPEIPEALPDISQGWAGGGRRV